MALMGEFRRTFERYGADYQSTMTRFIDNEKSYLRFLDMFLEDENLKKLGESLESNNLDDAFDAAHTLKGTTANMGLTPMFNAVCEIVEPLRQRKQQDYSEKYKLVCDEFSRVRELRTQLADSADN